MTHVGQMGRAGHAMSNYVEHLPSTTLGKLFNDRMFDIITLVPAWFVC